MEEWYEKYLGEKGFKKVFIFNNMEIVCLAILSFFFFINAVTHGVKIPGNTPTVGLKRATSVSKTVVGTVFIFLLLLITSHSRILTDV